MSAYLYEWNIHIIFREDSHTNLSYGSQNELINLIPVWASGFHL